jgi:hypothetical protein
MHIQPLISTKAPPSIFVAADLGKGPFLMDYVHAGDPPGWHLLGWVREMVSIWAFSC